VGSRLHWEKLGAKLGRTGYDTVGELGELLGAGLNRAGEALGAARRRTPGGAGHFDWEPSSEVGETSLSERAGEPLTELSITSGDAPGTELGPTSLFLSRRGPPRAGSTTVDEPKVHWGSGTGPLGVPWHRSRASQVRSTGLGAGAAPVRLGRSARSSTGPGTRSGLKRS
jgi:hypothetical protein